MLCLQASSALSAVWTLILAALVAKVGPLATVSSLLITGAAWWYFTLLLVEHLVAGLFVIAFPLLPLLLYIFVVGGGLF